MVVEKNRVEERITLQNSENHHLAQAMMDIHATGAHRLNALRLISRKTGVGFVCGHSRGRDLIL